MKKVEISIIDIINSIETYDIKNVSHRAGALWFKEELLDKLKSLQHSKSKKEIINSAYKEYLKYEEQGRREWELDRTGKIKPPLQFSDWLDKFYHSLSCVQLSREKVLEILYDMYCGKEGLSEGHIEMVENTATEICALSTDKPVLSEIKYVENGCEKCQADWETHMDMNKQWLEMNQSLSISEAANRQLLQELEDIKADHNSLMVENKMPQENLRKLLTDNKGEEKSKVLDEKGFVFIGKDKKPYWCRMWEESPWLFYWHPDNKWVSLKEVNQSDIFIARQSSLNEAEANIYHSMSTK